MDLPLGDKVAAMVFIGCGLGIAYLFELQREGIQLVSFKEFDNILNTFSLNEFHSLHQTNLNIQSLLKERSEEILEYKNEPEKRDDAIVSLVMDVVEKLPMGPNHEFMEGFKGIYE